MTIKIAVLDDYADVARHAANWDVLTDATVIVFNDTLTSQAELVERLQDFDVICLMRERTPFSADLIELLPRLRLIVTTGPRNLSIDLDAATARDITVCGTQSRKTTTAELAMLLMLTMSRQFPAEVQAMREHGWQRGLGRDLNGLDLGLIGLGNIGAQMTALGKAFGMSVHAWSPHLSQDRCRELAVTYHPDLKSLMASADVV
ncbi:MAG: D-2-hydroxyacid dehydrogenase family protein, partial [Granulosicoccus sp.]|nr:D-2-hydroxyacid dehydrogenase family protein [Granulosicoccus sp.]